ncbi:hypothetical protein EVAR_7851_1 [Eumeta japonica]|uniref:Uncharacterized protein n=1 Tax=Eumeta variegata TaxID=151549 RepID=A0A4C1TVD5_EUMVA|nr:hypothetical protein EVAR_7851_1 [Eumeta japonica]
MGLRFQESTALTDVHAPSAPSLAVRPRSVKLFTTSQLTALPTPHSFRGTFSASSRETVAPKVVTRDAAAPRVAGRAAVVAGGARPRDLIKSHRGGAGGAARAGAARTAPRVAPIALCQSSAGLT